jgi:hypothetical protein
MAKNMIINSLDNLETKIIIVFGCVGYLYINKYIRSVVA